jgi:hypothetical protein
MDQRHPEDGHHGVADVFLDRAAVTLDHLAHAREVAAHHVTQRFWVQLLAQRGRPGDVGEQDRHDLAGLARDGRCAERGSAIPAVPEALRVVFAA